MPVSYTHLDVYKRQALQGELGPHGIKYLEEQIEAARVQNINGILFDMAKLDSISSEALRYIVFGKQAFGPGFKLSITGANSEVKSSIEAVSYTHLDVYKRQEEYAALATKIAGLMPKAGGDPQRGGWYDVVERVLGPGEKFHRFGWHDRKAWLQQEQGILDYLILHGLLKDPDHLRLARES